MRDHDIYPNGRREPRELERGPLIDWVPRPGEYVLGAARMGSCPLVRPYDMAACLSVEVEGVRISHSPELTDRRICRVISVDTRPWDSPAARSARYRSDQHTHTSWNSEHWAGIDLMYEAWRHTVLCVLMTPLTMGELHALGVPRADAGYYKALYLRYAAAELTQV